METIRNYLEAMFANYPNTPSVLRARDELWQMMEDKYNELIEEGKTENEAVGTVISEFGNLSELAEALGLEEEVKEQKVIEEESPKVFVSLEETKEYLQDRKAASTKRSLGIFFCVLSIIGPILADFLLRGAYDYVGLLVMLGFVALGVVLIIQSTTYRKKYPNIKKGVGTINLETAKYVNDEHNAVSGSMASNRTIGIILCALSWVPCVIFEAIPVLSRFNEIGATIMFALIAFGVYLITNSAFMELGYRCLLTLNDAETVAGNYELEKKAPEYTSEAANFWMGVYWPTIACIYLIVSFVTFAWSYTWIIWPVAVVIFVLLKKALKK